MMQEITANAFSELLKSFSRLLVTVVTKYAALSMMMLSGCLWLSIASTLYQDNLIFHTLITTHDLRGGSKPPRRATGTPHPGLPPSGGKERSRPSTLLHLAEALQEVIDIA